jgi:hypothetical protein
MNNINIDTLENLSNKIKELEDSVSNSASWAQSNQDLRMDRDEILLLKESRMKLNRINNSFKSKPVFALFGASQVGKSYLIKNLLSVDGDPLQIILGDKSYEFLEKINPPGSGAESTGVVTRFTIDKVSKDAKFPVKAKLISISDLVIILTDCFLNDVDLNELINFDDFEQNIEALEKEFQDSDYSQDKLNEDNIFEIRDYFKNNFKKENLTRVLDGSNYWNRIGELISKIPPSRWVDIFSFYWDNNSEINKLFNMLNSELEKLGYSKSIFLSESSILRGGGEILDVTRVKEIFENDSSEQTVYSDSKKISINTNRLSAVISEVTLSVSEDLQTKKEFIQNTDLLDFPGARSRLVLNKITDEETPLMYLRGKISYLFKRYSTNLEINNLLFCINDQQIEVNELPSLLNEWISTNIGDSIDHRSTAISNLNTNPLFVIFTFFNNQLTFDSTNDNDNDLDYKWDNRFIKFFQEGIISTNYDWDTKWSNKNKLFNNFFMLRDYKYSADVFGGYDEEGTENSINKNRVDYMKHLKDSFINYPFVKDHFDKPTESWDSSATANSDGSELIINNLLPSANNLVKVNNSVKRCNIIKDQVLDCLNKYYVSENKEEERNKIIKNTLNTSLSLSRYIANQPHKFSLFIQSLQLSEDEIYNVFHENINYATVESTFSSKELLSNIYPYLSDNNSLDDNVEIIRKQEGLSTKEDVIEILETNGIDLSQFKKEESVNELGIILDKIIKLWEEKVKLNPNKMENDLLNQILSDLLATMKIQGLLEKIQDVLSPKFNRVRIEREDEIYFASITTNLINEFVTDFGTTSFDETTVSRLQDILSEREKEAYSELIIAKPIPTDDDLNNIFNDNLLEVNKSLKNYLSNFEDWKLRMKIALLNNCGYVDNEKNNKKVKELLLSIDNVNVSVD